MGARTSSYRRAMDAHEQRLRSANILYTDDVLSGDLVLICEMVSTGLESTASGYASHAVMNPALLKSVKRSQLGKPMHMSRKDISGFNRTGVVVCDRLGDKFVLEATAHGVQSTRLDELVESVQTNSGVVAIRQVDCLDGRKFSRQLLRIFDSTKDGTLTWDRAREAAEKISSGEKVDMSLEATAKLCAIVLRNIQHSKKVLSVETKAELDQMFSLYDRNGDGTIDEEELETMIDEIGGKALPTEERLRILTRLDVDNDGGISLDEFYKAMRELPGISSLNDRNIATLLSAQFTLQVYVAIGLLQGIDETMYVDADLLKFDAEVDFGWISADFYPETPLRVRPAHESRAKTSRLSKIPPEALRRRERSRKARASAQEAERESRERVRAADAERKQRVAEREKQIRQQIEQARLFKEKEREYQNQLHQEEERQRRAKEEEGRLKQQRNDRKQTAKPRSKGNDAADDVAESAATKPTKLVPEDADNTVAGKAHDAEIGSKNLSAVALKTASTVDPTTLQYYYVDFELQHTGVTVETAEHEGQQVWVVVDVRPGSEANDADVGVGHVLVAIDDVELDEGSLTVSAVNQRLRTGPRPLSVSFATTDSGSASAAASPGAKRSKTVRESANKLEDEDFEVVFKTDNIGIEVERVDDDGEEPYIVVAVVAKGSEADEADVVEDFVVVSIGGTEITGENCSEAVVAKLLKGKKPLSVVFGS